MRRIFGRSSEALSADQLELLLGGQAEGDRQKPTPPWALEPRKAATTDHESRHKERRRSPKERWPENLPVIEEVLDPEEVKAAPREWRRIGAEVSESLDYEPARFLRRRLVRNKYVPRQGVNVVPVIAALPPMLQERCTPAQGLLAAIIVAKFCDHLPLYRQESIFASRHDIHLSATARRDGWPSPRTGCGPFSDTRELAPQPAGFILRQIAHLYRLEIRLRQQDASPKTRALARGVESLPHPCAHPLRAPTLENGPPLPAQIYDGRGPRLRAGQLDPVRNYLRDGRGEIDNNTIENSIRPTAIGKKNWLFMGGAHTGQRSTVLYTIIESRRRLNPFDYLRDVLTRLPSMTNRQVKDITPTAWTASQRPAPSNAPITHRWLLGVKRLLTSGSPAASSRALRAIKSTSCSPPLRGFYASGCATPSFLPPPPHRPIPNLQLRACAVSFSGPGLLPTIKIRGDTVGLA